MKWLKRSLIATVFVALALPFVPANLFRARIQSALERSLGRKVEIGSVHFTLLPNVLPGPGFTLDQVLIHEDSRAGIEPFAYVDSLGASVRLRSLFSRKLEFSSLNLGDATINIVKTDPGPWNFQFLLASAASNPRAMPSIRMRGGRVNFKFGDTKSVFYLNNADLDVQPSSDGSYELRFGGAPSRTNRTAQEFGRLFISGTSSAAHQLDFNVDLERSGLEETLRWISPNSHGLHGTVRMEARVTGPSSNLVVDGHLEIGDVHRWDVLPAKDSAFRADFKGTLNLPGERLALSTTSPAPAVTQAVTQVVARVEATHWLSVPAWNASADIDAVPLDTLVKIARHMGTDIPQEIAAEGMVSGSLRYSDPQGVTGRIELGEASLSLAGAEPLRADSAAVSIADGVARLEKTTVRAPKKQSAEIDGTYALTRPAGEPRETSLRISTRGLDVGQSQATAAIPVISATPKGTWRGQVRYSTGVWTGDITLEAARINVDGLAQPVDLESATVKLNGPNITVTNLKAHAGEVAFTGGLRIEPAAARPYRFALSIPDADGAALAKLLAPTLSHEGGFFSRTLGIGSPSKTPPWLDGRKAEGTIAVDSLTLGDSTARALSARLMWDGAKVRLNALKATLDGSPLSGDLTADLAGPLPKLHFEGKLDDYTWHGGAVSLEGKIEAGGDVRDFLASIHAEGAIRARSIAFAPDADFRTATGAFDLQGFGPTAKWKLSNLELTQAGDALTGTGSTQDGKLQLDLIGKGKPIRYSAAFASPPAAP